ncbi:hypothetical protein PCE1_004834 [Barthelona sp. PCE]
MAFGAKKGKSGFGRKGKSTGTTKKSKFGSSTSGKGKSSTKKGFGGGKGLSNNSKTFKGKKNTQKSSSKFGKNKQSTSNSKFGNKNKNQSKFANNKQSTSKFGNRGKQESRSNSGRQQSRTTFEVENEFGSILSYSMQNQGALGIFDEEAVFYLYTAHDKEVTEMNTVHDDKPPVCVALNEDFGLCAGYVDGSLCKIDDSENPEEIIKSATSQPITSISIGDGTLAFTDGSLNIVTFEDEPTIASTLSDHCYVFCEFFNETLFVATYNSIGYIKENEYVKMMDAPSFVTTMNVFEGEDFLVCAAGTASGVLLVTALIVDDDEFITGEFQFNDFETIRSICVCCADEPNILVALRDALFIMSFDAGDEIEIKLKKKINVSVDDRNFKTQQCSIDAMVASPSSPEQFAIIVQSTDVIAAGASYIRDGTSLSDTNAWLCTPGS